MTVDGERNRVDEVEVVARIPAGPDNPRGITVNRRTLDREGTAQRDAEPLSNRQWHIVNPERTNRLGRPVGYALKPKGHPTLMADPGSSIAARAAFATRHLWVTRYAREERYPAGDFVNQHAGGAGLPAWSERDADIDNKRPRRLAHLRPDPRPPDRRTGRSCRSSTPASA